MTDTSFPHQVAANFVRQTINALAKSNNAPKVRAILARLRRGVSMAPGADPDIWDVTLAELPNELVSTNGIPTKGEWAVQIALTLFAMHQQGRDIQSDCVHYEDVKEKTDNDTLKSLQRPQKAEFNPHSFGCAVRSLAGEKDSDAFKAVRRRFNATVTSESIEEFAHHLRGMIQLIKAKSNIKLDYVALTREIYLFQNPENRDSLRLRWGQDFYR
ncbi:MAG: type I-E CRISPR-associated protein Cse2/CasB [Proteobacteria bacterium]|nr:type I-E CRISPR-associated protein Cse2/CasB [Pseudomonadota bacterium]